MITFVKREGSSPTKLVESCESGSIAVKVASACQGRELGDFTIVVQKRGEESDPKRVNSNSDALEEEIAVAIGTYDVTAEKTNWFLVEPGEAQVVKDEVVAGKLELAPPNDCNLPLITGAKGILHVPKLKDSLRNDPMLYLKYLKAALNGAYDGSQLNIITGREWYIRSRKGPIPPGAFLGIVDGVLTLSREFPKAIILPGTILWAFFDPELQKFIVLNTQIAVQNGALLHLQHKNFLMGDTDRLHTRKDSSQTVYYSDKSLKLSAIKNNNNSIFFHQGLTYSIDICKDHDQKVALGHYEKYFPEGLGPDFHIVSSTGIRFDISGAMFCAKQGVGLHVDGGSTIYGVYKLTRATKLNDVTPTMLVGQSENLSQTLGGLRSTTLTRVEFNNEEIGDDALEHESDVPGQCFSKVVTLKPVPFDPVKIFKLKILKLPSSPDTFFAALECVEQKIDPTELLPCDVVKLARACRSRLYLNLFSDADQQLNDLVREVCCANVEMFLSCFRRSRLLDAEGRKDFFKKLLCVGCWDELIPQFVATSLKLDIVIFQDLGSCPVRAITWDFRPCNPLALENAIYLLRTWSSAHFDLALLK